MTRSGSRPSRLFEESEARRKRWQEASEAYEAERRPRVAAQPSLAMYADQPGAAEKLRRLSAMSDDEVGATATKEIDERLENIATVRPEIGAGFKVWGQSHLRRVTLDQMQATPLQRSIVDRKVRTVAGAGDDKTLFMLLAIGLGILAAIPSGGSSLVAGIGAAAAAAGAGLALYEVGKEIDQYSLAAAANATDFDKAKAISGNEPDAMNLALAVVGAVADVFAAAHAFKTLKTVFLAAKAGDVKAAIKFVELADGVGVQGATKQQLVGEAVAEPRRRRHRGDRHDRGPQRRDDGRRSTSPSCSPASAEHKQFQARAPGGGAVDGARPGPDSGRRARDDRAPAASACSARPA